MAIHVGIDPFWGKAAAYNEIQQNDIQQIYALFITLTKILTDKLGCACIFLYDYYNNETRKQFIEICEMAGFLKVQFIDWAALRYLYHVFRSEYKPSPGDFIWIRQLRQFYVWKKADTQTKMAKSLCRLSVSKKNELLKLRKSPGRPQIVFFSNDTNTQEKRKMFAECKFHSYTIAPEDKDVKLKATLLKARIMGSDSEVLAYNVDMCLNNVTRVILNGKEVLSFKKFQSLPLTNSFEVIVGEGENLIEIVDDTEKLLFQRLPPSTYIEKRQISLDIDINKIFTINYSIMKSIAFHRSIFTSGKFQSLSHPSLSPYFCGAINKVLYKIPLHVKTNHVNTNALGIDLGTSRCCAAVNRRNGIETVALDNTGERMLPSYVSYNDKKEICGQIAVNHLQHCAKSVVFDTKRMIGKNYSQLTIDSNWPFKILNFESDPKLRIMGQKSFFDCDPEEVTAVLLKTIRQKVEAFQGKKFEEVVITVPASFTEGQKAATHYAAKSAGWKIIHLLPEPVAAAFAYFIDRPIPNFFKMLLFHFGGGTLDVCIFSVTNRTLEMISQKSDANFGGKDFDNLLFDHFLRILKKIFEIDLNGNSKLNYRLVQKCMEIKHILSCDTKAMLDVSDYKPNSDDTVNITRTEFEEMAAQLLNNVKKIIQGALTSAHYTTRDIHKVLLSGGSCRMPMIKMMLQKWFSKAEYLCDENPDEVAAIGAAYHSYYLYSPE